MSLEGGNNNNNNNINGSRSSTSNNSGNFVTRSWARISGRRKKNRIPTTIEEGIEINEDQPIPSTSSSQQIPWKLANNTNNIEEKPKPFLNRGMDKLRRSIRKSFRKAPSLSGDATTSSGNHSIIESTSSSSTPWEADAKNVRAGICKFNVKYLGSCEVYESRGVHVCEGAITHLKTRKKPTKSILYISGDGLRVVDRESNRGLIVDQTIEKVSFCAPDRHCDKGFAYICREGASRRWMCHGFLTTKESGERVSHAVGCAFTICLEAKKKREAEQAAAASGGTATTTSTTTPASKSETTKAETSSSKFSDLNAVWNAPPPEPPAANNFSKHSNPAYASFRRQLSITERKQDPQTAIVNEPLPPPTTLPSSKSVINESTIKPRPIANPSLFDRQGSFRGPTVSQQAFKRFNSLRADLLSRPALDSTRLLNTEPIYEGDEAWPESNSTTNSIINTLPVSTSLQFNHIAEGNKENGTEWNGIFNPACQSTPLHSSRQPSNQTHSKADEWLEKTFKSLSFQAEDIHIPQSQSIDFLGPIISGPPPSQAPPPLPTSRPVCEQFPSSNAMLPTTTATVLLPSTTAISTSAVINTVPFDVTDSIKTHARKGSSSKKSIEYQLLEEDPAPISPPRNTPIAKDAFGLPVFVPPPPPPSSTSNGTTRTGPSLSDPFDIQWSAEVLKNVTTPPISNGTTGGMSNPFTSESAPVNV
jgi:hypothetical protein